MLNYVIKQDRGIYKVTFGEKVKYVRGELQLSQMQLASELGVSFATVNGWETQNIEPRFLTKVKFEKFCKQKDVKDIEG